MLELKSELLCVLKAELDESQQVGMTPKGARIIAPVSGGTVKGEKVNGEVLSFGADWLLFRADGVGEIDVRATLRTDDGEFIYAFYRGILKVDPELFAKVQAGEEVDPSEYYFRTTPMFETGSEKYAWLNDIVCVGVGKIGLHKVEYKIYQIL